MSEYKNIKHDPTKLYGWICVICGAAYTTKEGLVESHAHHIKSGSDGGRTDMHLPAKQGNEGSSPSHHSEGD